MENRTNELEPYLTKEFKLGQINKLFQVKEFIRVNKRTFRYAQRAVWLDFKLNFSITEIDTVN